MKPITIKLHAGISEFTDDKDEAKRIRIQIILPALEKNQRVILDFKKVKSSTQSFVHALLGEVLQRFKEPALNKMEFRNCAPLMKSLIELVVDYSLGGFKSDQPPATTIALSPSNSSKKKKATG
jgi:hypothetical protein